MRVRLYEPDFIGMHSCAGKVTTAMSEGLTKLGVEHEVLHPAAWDREVVDVAVVNGWEKKLLDKNGGRTRNEIIRAQRDAGNPAWCLERAFVKDREIWSALSIGGFSAHGDFRADDMPGDRWKAFDIPLEPWRGDGDYILLCAQVPWDAQVDEGNHIKWLDNTVKFLASKTELPIVFRAHPKAYRNGNADPYGGLSFDSKLLLRVEVTKPSISFESQLARAAAVVCFNSNVAVLSTIAGVPVFTGAPCMADPIARPLGEFPTNLAPIQPKTREQWAHNLAYKQWHLEEYREGLPWLHLTR